VAEELVTLLGEVLDSFIIPRYKQRKVPDFLRNQELFGGDYWTRTSDLLRVNGLGKLFPTVFTPIQHRRIRIQNYLTTVCPSVSAHSAPHCGYCCGQNRFPPDLQIQREAVFLVCSLPLNEELSNSFSGLIPKANTTPP